MMWPAVRRFLPHRSHRKPKVQDVVQAELARKEREARNAARMYALQKALEDALSELGPQKNTKVTHRD